MQAITYDVTRDEWDPNDNTPSATRTSEDIRGFELHHTGGTGPRSLTFQDKADWLLGIERYHELSKKWSDIFYNLFVFGDGEIWEGRRSDRSSQSSVAQYLTVHVRASCGWLASSLQILASSVATQTGPQQSAPAIPDGPHWPVSRKKSDP